MYGGTSIKPRAKGLAEFVHYNEVLFINFTITGVKKIVRYITEDFVI